MLHAAGNTTAAGVVGSGGGSGGNNEAVDDADLFAKELGARITRTEEAGNTTARALEKLAAAFPGATISTRSMSSFAETGMYYSATREDLSVNINPDVLAQLADDEETFSKVKSMIENLFTAGNSRNLTNSGGAAVQRSVNVSATEIRYVEVQRGSGGTSLSVSSLALETQKMEADLLDMLLGNRQNGSAGQFDFASFVSSSQFWRLQGVVSGDALTQTLRSQQSAIMSMDVIIEQWEASGTGADLFTYMQVMGLCDPLVLDLGDEGINLGSVDDGVYFDIKGDGTPVRTAWIRGNNAFLYLDENGNGVADGAGELFGDHGGFANGFEKLAQYDDNGDGVIDENDEIYSQLRLWRDLNGDGVNQIEESLALAEAGVKSINLRHDDRRTLDAHGNVIGERSSFTRVDGTSGLVADVWLRNR